MIHFDHVKHGSARPQLHNIYRRLLPLELFIAAVFVKVCLLP